jgi:hypothetical protein
LTDRNIWNKRKGKGYQLPRTGNEQKAIDEKNNCLQSRVTATGDREEGKKRET